MHNLTELIESLKFKGVLNDPLIESAFREIDRKYFVPPHLLRFSYEDRPLPIGSGQTISQPYTVAFMLELLEVHPGHTILDIGCGSGYTTGLLSKITGTKGKVWAVDRLPELVDLAKSNLSSFEIDNIEVLSVPGGVGLPGRKFDRILVSASAGSFPQELVAQLNIGGRIVIPVNNYIMLYEKEISGKLNSKEHFGFSFVPLIID